MENKYSEAVLVKEMVKQADPQSDDEMDIVFSPHLAARWCAVPTQRKGLSYWCGG
jgi:hypothetical protein